MSQYPKALPASATESTKKTSIESFKKILKATADLFSKQLSDDELRVWKDLLNLCSQAEAEAAFKQWQMTGAWFPKPTEILQYVADARDERKIAEEGCSKECQKMHGRGYGENDIRWLWKRYSEQRAIDPEVKPEQFLDELDSKREGGAPGWRREHGTRSNFIERGNSE